MRGPVIGTLTVVKDTTRIRAATMRRNRNQVDQLDAASVMILGICGKNSPSKCSVPRDGALPNICLKMVQDANLALTDEQLDEICEHAQSEYVLNIFFSISTGQFDGDTGTRKGSDCEVGG